MNLRIGSCTLLVRIELTAALQAGFDNRIIIQTFDGIHVEFREHPVTPELLLINSIEYPLAVAPVPDQSSLAQDLQVVGNSRLGHPQCFHEFTNTLFAPRQHLQNP